MATTSVIAITQRVATLRHAVGASITTATTRPGGDLCKLALRVSIFIFVGYHLGARLGLALTVDANPDQD